MTASAVPTFSKPDIRSNLFSTNGEKGSRVRGSAQHRLDGFVFALNDVLFACGGGLLVYQLRFSSTLFNRLVFLDHPAVHKAGHPVAHLAFLLLYVVLLILSAHAQNLYRPTSIRSPLTESLLVLRAVIMATLVLTAFIYLSGILTISRLVVGLNSVLSVLALASWRTFRWHVVRKRCAHGHGLEHALIIGAGSVGQFLAHHLEQNRHLGYEVRGFLDGNHDGQPQILGDIDDLARVVQEEFVDDVFITIPSERELVKKVALEARRLRLNVKVVPELYDGLAWLSPIEFVGDVPVRVLHREPIPAFGLLIKRLMDIFGSIIGLTLLSPLFVLIALAIKFDSPGPIFYRGQRVGRKGRTFFCHKFRTMVADADKLKDSLRHLNERKGPIFKIANDPRLTQLGSFMRRYSLDELPQFWNVLKGEMSLVGPRPPEPSEITEYSLEHLRRLDVTPGMTGLWQITARHDPSFEKVVVLDNHYIENWSLLLDLKILLKTMLVVVEGMGR